MLSVYFLENIVKYIPFDDLVRISESTRSETLFRTSLVNISRRKILTIDLSKPFWSPAHVSDFVNLCAKNVERIHMMWTDNAAVLEAFAGVPLPNLRFLKCSEGKFATLGGETKILLEAVLENKPELKELIITLPGFASFSTTTITADKLEKLQCRVRDEGLRSLTGRVPNLVHLKVKITLSESPPMVLNRFLNTVPLLEKLKIEIEIGGTGLDLERDLIRMDALWRLGRLTVLKVSSGDGLRSLNAYMGDNALMRVAQSFPLLRVLWAPVSGPGITNPGVAALSSLAELRELTFDGCNFREGGQRNLSVGVRALTKCAHLRSLRFLDNTGSDTTSDNGIVLTPHVLSELMRSCADLSQVELSELVALPAIHSEREAAAFVVEAFTGLGGGERGRKIFITFRTTRTWCIGIWRSELVNQVLEKLKKEQGVKVKFQFTGTDEK